MGQITYFGNIENNFVALAVWGWISDRYTENYPIGSPKYWWTQRKTNFYKKENEHGDNKSEIDLIKNCKTTTQGAAGRGGNE